MMFKALALVVVATGTAQTLEVPSWAYMVVTLLGAGGLFRFFMLRTEKRLSDAGATKTEAEADEIGDRVRKALMAEVEVQMQATRREAEHARTMEAAAQRDLAEAQAEVAKMVLEHQRDREAWRNERHDLVNAHRNEMNTKDREIAELKSHIAVLQEKVRALEIGAGYAKGRREEDDKTKGRMAVLEDRADRAQQRADRAQDVAEKQEHRNDETPGHA